MMKLKGVFQQFTNRNFQYRAGSFWSKVPLAPPDPIFGITERFLKDTDSKKVNLGVGAYKGDNGKPFKLESVMKAEEIIWKKDMNKEYLPMTGHFRFVKRAVKLALKDAPQLKERLNASAQSLSGSGALYMLSRFMALEFNGPRIAYLPQPTWGNHGNIMKTAHLKIKSYTYYDPKTLGFDFKGCVSSIAKIPKGSIILFHTCAHNPTGIDPSPEEWKELSQVVKKRNLLPFFDTAYQGFATGDLDRDAYSVRLFLKDGHRICLAQSFSKNMGLYGERIGTCTIMCKNKEERKKVRSRLKILIRALYSNPPLQGARIVEEILSNEKLRQIWLKELKKMSGRIIKMRKSLRSLLKKAGSKKNWDHITKQIGMFCFSGLTKDQVEKLASKYHIYMTTNGRIAVVGLVPGNVEYVANAIHDVTK